MKAIKVLDNGFAVSVCFLEDGDSWRFRPVINFGDRQSDAIEFVKDIEEGYYSETRLIALAKSYKNDVYYRRISKTDLRKQQYESN